MQLTCMAGGAVAHVPAELHPESSYAAGTSRHLLGSSQVPTYEYHGGGRLGVEQSPVFLVLLPPPPHPAVWNRPG
jgi:hypothetical protein